MPIKTEIDATKVTGIDVLKNKAMKITLNRRKLNRNAIDKDISIEVKDMKGVTENGALRVNKSLFSKQATDTYMKLYNEASKYYYRCTTPWDNNGWRLLSVDMFEEFTKRFKKFTMDYRSAVVDFINQVESHVEEAKGILGSAFKIEDYKFISANGSVDRQMLEDCFELSLEFDVITAGEDIRCELTEADRDAIAEQVNKASLAKFARTQEAIAKQLVDCIGALHERLSGSDNVFRDTLIGNLEDLCDLVPRMNIAGDEAMNKLAQDAKRDLCSWDPQTLRTNEEVREAVSKRADNLLKNAKGLI